MINLLPNCPLLLLLVACLCGAAGSAADRPPAPPQAEPSPPPVILTINLTGSDGRPACGMVTILDGKGHPALPTEEIAVEGTIKVPLAKGVYSVIATGGLRILPVTRVVKLTPQDAVVNLLLADYAPVRRAGWKQCCLYFAPSEAPSPAQPCTGVGSLQVLARSRGIDLLGCGGLWRLPAADGTPYAISPDGAKELQAALSGSETLVLDVWSTSHPGAGNLLALEPAPVRAPDEQMDGTSLLPTLAGLRDRGGVSALCLPTGLSAAGQEAGELPYATIAGPLYDQIDISRQGDDLRLWWTVLNLGYRLPACGGGDRSVLRGDPPRTPQTGMYLLLPRSTPDARLFLDILKSGQSIVSNGPFLRILVQRPEAAARPAPSSEHEAAGQICQIGETTPPSAHRRRISIDAYSCSDPADSIRRIELIYNGEVIRTQNLSRPGQKTINANWSDVILDRTGWLVARYYSHARNLWAITNPVYVRDGASPPPLPAGATCRVTVKSGTTGNPVPARLRALNFGTVIGSWETEGKEVTLNLPATAMVEVQAPGYETVSAGVYRNGGSAAWLDALKKTSPDYLLNARTYQQLREALKQSRLDFTLTAVR